MNALLAQRGDHGDTVLGRSGFPERGGSVNRWQPGWLLLKPHQALFSYASLLHWLLTEQLNAPY